MIQLFISIYPTFATLSQELQTNVEDGKKPEVERSIDSLITSRGVCVSNIATAIKIVHHERGGTFIPYAEALRGLLKSLLCILCQSNNIDWILLASVCVLDYCAFLVISSKAQLKLTCRLFACI